MVQLQSGESSGRPPLAYHEEQWIDDDRSLIRVAGASSSHQQHDKRVSVARGKQKLPPEYGQDFMRPYAGTGGTREIIT